MWGIAKAFACFLNKLHKFKKTQKTDSTTPHVTRKCLQARVKKKASQGITRGLQCDISG